MQEQFVTYEIALKLKKLGFDEPCLGYYEVSNNLESGFRLRFIEHEDSNPSKQPLNKDCLAPIWQQAIDWFRYKHKLYVNIEPKITKEWEFSISNLNEGLLFGNKSLYINKNLDYYKAREQAILKALEIIKNSEI